MNSIEKIKGKEFYEAIVNFDESEEARDYYEDFMKAEADEEAREKDRAQIIANFVAANDLDISQYKDFGWDPVFSRICYTVFEIL